MLWEITLAEGLLYRKSPHSTYFSIVHYFKNMNSSDKKVYPPYSTAMRGLPVPSLPTGFMSGLILLCINVVIILSFFVRI